MAYNSTGMILHMISYIAYGTNSITRSGILNLINDSEFVTEKYTEIINGKIFNITYVHNEPSKKALSDLAEEIIKMYSE